ncbi:MAG: type II restriction endonuclease subunit R [Nitrosopumilus sp. B06]|nr:MAG: type II restriction endonuclease subunit R [Nitrosopumilus sp. B06]
MEDLFTDPEIITKIQNKLPRLFNIAEAEASRGGKVGMEIGSVRERVIIALFRHYFGREKVIDDIPITETETDVIVHGRSISIKTKTGQHYGGIKAVWTVDWERIEEYVSQYHPAVDLIIARITWGSNDGGLYLIPLQVQKNIFAELGVEGYLKIPKKNTNPRGVEYSKAALESMFSDDGIRRLEIEWVRSVENVDVFEKWERYWEEN